MIAYINLRQNVINLVLKRYRLIDFALSNLVNANITKVGIVTKQNYQSSLFHLPCRNRVPAVGCPLGNFRHGIVQYARLPFGLSLDRAMKDEKSPNASDKWGLK